ncbi:MAG: SIR2 family protein [Cetobacterium sp.]|uniref:SIR2 family protein n=1 Tax=unclassified Cetobacterium TaxID=2630983 RepID=UPI000645BDC0|nr:MULTISPECIES: SIR2 family protein [unclassified Cetobacterium]
MSFFNKFNDTDKINLFLGDFLVRQAGYPTRRELAKLLMKDMKENIKGYIRDENSLFQVSQVYLDGVVSSRSSLLRKIKNLYETNRETSELLNVFSESDKINAVFSTDYDIVLDDINSSKVVKILPTDENICTALNGEIKHYKVLGDVNRHEKLFVSIQDYRKLNVLDFYKNFFNNIREDIKTYPTLILGLDLNNIDFIDMLESILSTIEKRDIIYAVSNSNVLKTKTIERLNELGIKLLPHSEEEFFKELKCYLCSEELEESELQEAYIGKKLFR